MKQYKIERNVPFMPKKKSESLAYVYKKMQPGDSVLVPEAKAANAFWVAQKRNLKAIFRKQKDGSVRVWMITPDQFKEYKSVKRSKASKV